MKKNFKQALVPLAVMVFGAAAAFATNAAKQSDAINAPVTKGYIYDTNLPSGTRCVMVDVECDNQGDYICTNVNGSHLWKFDAETDTGCTELLTRINP
ncbi:hypothetical protein H1R17_10090 [Flavobacterium sp. xlx-214]|uniref:DUF6520 family protein n=1 Tax=unclassified Flavobacterium TaxID=196869 RepID=UPI0013D4A9F3|nr:MULTISPECIES: DUF6520 family protein [unclassified Flavobacterium]MBA5791563.1 hypothetical protein [Flavobacterium sp. xlx-221]QMI82812.1 hypothetical protein H1R17_10090 [Flavobacterium sp. xlx-214]